MMRQAAAIEARVRRAMVALLAVVAAYCVLQTGVHFAWNLSRVSSSSDVFSFLLFMMEDTTMYSEAYSETGFKQVSESMTAEDVRRILGEPLSRQAVQGGELWRYTKGLPDMNFWLRVVEIDARGVVRGRIRQYWDD